MIEVNLFSVPAGAPDASAGRLVARSRFDRETMGVSIMEFVKGFLRQNMENFEAPLGNADLVGFINSDGVMSTVEFASINYYLGQVGYTVKIWNVADDEENATTIPSGEAVEWNVVNKNFIQHDYPTTTKIIPSEGMGIDQILKQIVEQSGLFSTTKFSGSVNPFRVLVNNLEHIREVTGEINATLTSRIYQILDLCGFEIFCATSED